MKLTNEQIEHLGVTLTELGLDSKEVIRDNYSGRHSYDFTKTTLGVVLTKTEYQRVLTSLIDDLVHSSGEDQWLIRDLMEKLINAETDNMGKSSLIYY